MSDIRLPQRPMVELPPPSDGLDQVRGEAGRRRRRRAGVVGASLTTAAGVAVVVALSGGSGGLAVLKPAPPAAPGYVQPMPTVTGAAGVDRTSHHHRTHTTQLSASGHKAGHASPHHATAGQGTDTVPPPATEVAPQTSGQVAGAQEPTLSRWQSTYTGATRECSGSTYSGPGGTFESAVGWCAEATATTVSHGVRLQFQLCRDSTGGGTLSFPGTREIDFAVHQGSKTIWDWAKVHPGGSGAHQLSEPANGCMNWSLVWPDVTQAGSSAGHGTFTFVGTSTASEMQGKPDESVGFSY